MANGITRGTDISAVAPPNNQYNDRTYPETPLLEDVVRGDELKLTSTGYRKREAGERADGIALMDGRDGQTGFDIGVIGELDGFSGLTPGASLYPDADTEGGLSTDVLDDFVPQVKAIRATRIRFNYTAGGPITPSA
jgi:hypothetical protein